MHDRVKEHRMQECSSTKSLLSSSRSELPFTCIYQKKTSVANEKVRVSPMF